MFTLLGVLKKSNTYNCIYKTSFGCLLINQCKCIKYNQNDKWEDTSKHFRKIY